MRDRCLRLMRLLKLSDAGVVWFPFSLNCLRGGLDLDEAESHLDSVFARTGSLAGRRRSQVVDLIVDVACGQIPMRLGADLAVSVVGKGDGLGAAVGLTGDRGQFAGVPVEHGDCAERAPGPHRPARFVGDALRHQRRPGDIFDDLLDGAVKLVVVELGHRAVGIDPAGRHRPRRTGASGRDELHHLAGGSRLFTLTAVGGTHAVIPHFDADDFLDAIERFRVTVTVVVPTMLNSLLQHPKIQDYDLSSLRLLTYGASAVIVAFLLLPAFVAALTPFTFRQVSRASRDPLIAAFVIGNTFVVLPMIIDSLNRLFRERNLTGDPENQDADYLVPMAYPFPDIGRIVGLIFIPFAATAICAEPST